MVDKLHQTIYRWNDTQKQRYKVRQTVQPKSLMDLQYSWELERFNEWNEGFFANEQLTNHYYYWVSFSLITDV
jgi:hypothetical protein